MEMSGQNERFVQFLAGRRRQRRISDVVAGYRQLRCRIPEAEFAQVGGL